jgi:hypothetical protein
MTREHWWTRLTRPARSPRGSRLRLSARPAVEFLEGRCLPATSTVNATLINNTGSALVLDSFAVESGTYGQIPPSRIEVGQTVNWETESSGLFSGNEGRAVYHMEGTPARTPWFFTLHWNNPFVTPCTYDETAPAGFSANHSGGSGANAFVTYRLGIVDSSGDGIPDAWKTNGIDFDGDGTIDFKPANATVGRKDIYVEVDGMTGRAPAQSTLNAVVTAFANAPVTNTNGSSGISLHLDLDDTSIPLANWGNPPTSNNPWPNFDAAKAAWFGTAAERASPNAANILGAKALIYHYCIFANNQGTNSSSGLSEIGGNDFMVTLGLWSTPGGTVQQQEGTFMHELGHDLGLQHGGGDGINNKPNYNSVMNYTWQTPKSWMSVDTNGFPVPSIWRLDYSRTALPTLDESHLDETKGIQGPSGVWTLAGPKGKARVVSETGAVNWDNDRDGGTQTDVPADVNFDGTSNQVLTGYNDWANLQYNFRGSPKFLPGNHGDEPDTEPEMTYELDQALNGATSTQVSSDVNASTYGQTVTLSATVTSMIGTTPTGGTVQFFDGANSLGSASVSDGTASIAVSSLGAGSHSLTAVYGGSGFFQTSTSSAYTQQVTRAHLTVTADDKSRFYGDDNPPLTATITGFVLGQTLATSGVSGSPSLSTTATAASDVGGYTIGVSQGSLAAANYDFTFTAGTLTVTAAPLTVTADSFTRTYGSPNPTLTGTVTGVRNNDAISATYSTTATQSGDVGTYPITPSLVDPNGRLGDYAVTINNGTLTITKAHLTVTADSLTKIYRAANPPLTATITGFVLGQTLATSGVTGVPALSTTATADSPVGTYPITVAIGTLAATNYDFTAFTPGTLSITYAIRVLFDQDHAKDPNSTIPVKIELDDAFGNNVGSSSVGVHALAVVPASDPSVKNPPQSPGNSQAGDAFRFTGGAYLFDLKNTGRGAGDYVFEFWVDGDPLVHEVKFSLS